MQVPTPCSPAPAEPCVRAYVLAGLADWRSGRLPSWPAAGHCCCTAAPMGRRDGHWPAGPPHRGGGEAAGGDARRVVTDRLRCPVSADETPPMDVNATPHRHDMSPCTQEHTNRPSSPLPAEPTGDSMRVRPGRAVVTRRRHESRWPESPSPKTAIAATSTPRRTPKPTLARGRPRTTRRRLDSLEGWRRHAPRGCPTAAESSSASDRTTRATTTVQRQEQRRRQVRTKPKGSVDTGDGSSAPTHGTGGVGPHRNRRCRRDRRGRPRATRSPLHR